MRLPAPARRTLSLIAAVVSVAALAAVPAAADDGAFADTHGTIYAAAVDALADDGVVEGCEDGRFCPTDTVTRAQLASLLARALDLPASDVDHFADDGGDHEDSINAVAEAGITRGCTEARFCPDRPVGRAQMATMLDRAWDLADADVRYFTDVGGTHAASIRRVAAAGVTGGCADGHFCPDEKVLRGQMALFLGRALDLVESADPITLADYEAQVEAQRQAAAEAERKAAEQEEREAAERERLRIWERLAECESGGNWSINTGNGYYGGLQFSLSSWRGVGGSGYPHRASKAEQIRRGELLQDRQGWGAWPHCSRKLGLR